MEMLEVTAAIIRQDERVLICQRPANKDCGLLWEFPGGKIEAGETGERCIIRECQEELGVTLRVERKLTDITYEYPDRIVHLHFYLCCIVQGKLERKEHAAFAWVTNREIAAYEFCPADAVVVQMLCEKSQV
ncbi:MAG: 8-oxo-dGTP diphosphatase MutT [Oscillospiraceae bacterium]|nr:8-oxo-dGTP diphosphatase MutT [Oscillospiraceae bacterium]